MYRCNKCSYYTDDLFSVTFNDYDMGFNNGVENVKMIVCKNCQFDIVKINKDEEYYKSLIPIADGQNIPVILNDNLKKNGEYIVLFLDGDYDIPNLNKNIIIYKNKMGVVITHKNMKKIKWNNKMDFLNVSDAIYYLNYRAYDVFIDVVKFSDDVNAKIFQILPKFIREFL